MALLIAMIPLGDGAALSLDGFVRDARDRWGANVQVQPKTEDFATLFTWNGVELIVASMSAPIPWTDLEYLSTVSRLWPDASGELRGHTDHLILSVLADSQKVSLDLLGTKATASLLATTPSALGVYTRAPLLIRKDIYVDYATSVLRGNGMPVDLWVDIQVGGSETAQAAGYTRGLAAFGLMELEAPTASEAPDELRDRLWSLAAYLLENGPVIRDGNTVGADDTEHITVTYSDSAFGLPGQVMRLEYA